jgi:nucleoside 2-deoxyribosyltransferase
MHSVYLSGPDVFLPDMMAVLAAKMMLCVGSGFVPKIPSDPHHAPPTADGTNPSRNIYRDNAQAMRDADFGIFHLTPFRGISADPGSVYELGFMTALGKPAFGYTNVPGDYMDRVVPKQSLPSHDNQVTWQDDDGCHIENYGNADNLMIDSSLELYGALIVRGTPPLPKRFSDLSAFRKCLDLAKTHYASAK